ncbi:hypothetical protein AAMO2058_001322000 [Amorphochlora amoebiformis]
MRKTRVHPTSSSPAAKKARIEAAEGKVEISNDRWTRSLKWFLGPETTPLDFFQNIFEQKPLHIRAQGDDKKEAAEFFSYQVLLNILTNNQIYYNESMTICVYKDGKRQVAELDGRATKEQVDELYSKQNHTIQFYRPQVFSDPIWRLNHEFENDFGDLVGASVYLTPPNSQGLAPHHDDVEVFIIQTQGRKRWRIFEPLEGDELPRDHSNDMDLAVVENNHKLLLDITLQPGDRLYLPRGFIHYATTATSTSTSTEGATSSCHVTVSTFQKHSFTDFLLNLAPVALRRAFEEDPAFRIGLPIDYATLGGSSGVQVNRYLEDVKEEEEIEERSEKSAKFISTIREMFLKLARYVDQDSIGTCCDEMAIDFVSHRLPPIGREEPQGKPHNPLDPNDNKIEFRICNPKTIHIVTKESGTHIFHCNQNDRSAHMGPQDAFNDEEEGQPDPNKHPQEEDEEEEEDEIGLQGEGVVVIHSKCSVVVAILVHCYPNYLTISELTAKVTAIDAAEGGPLTAMSMLGLRSSGLLEERTRQPKIAD